MLATVSRFLYVKMKTIMIKFENSKFFCKALVIFYIHTPSLLCMSPVGRDLLVHAH